MSYPTDPEQRCNGTAKRSGKPCTRPVIPGGTVCRYHGGGAPQVIRAAERRLVSQRAAAVVATYGLPVVTTAEDALLDELYRSKGHVMWLEERVRQLDPDALVWGRASTVDKQASEFPGLDTTEAAAVNVWLELYQRERKHYFDVAHKCVQLGLQSRALTVMAQHGQTISSLLRSVVLGLGLDPAAPQVVEVVTRELRVLDSAMDGRVA